MEEKIYWEHMGNTLAKKPEKMYHYLVKGFTIREGVTRKVLKLTGWDGSKWEHCDDMVVEVYARIPL